MSESTEIACIIVKTTPKAVRVTDTVTEEWLPKSQILNWDEEEMDVGCEVVLDIPEWLAIDKGLA